jgi:hypothetical protein
MNLGNNDIVVIGKFLVYLLDENDTDIKIQYIDTFLNLL